MEPRFDPLGSPAPAEGDLGYVTWQASLGPFARPGQLADHLRDLGSALDAGERWGSVLARRAVYRQLQVQLLLEGPRFVEAAVGELGYRPRELPAQEHWLHAGLSAQVFPHPEHSNLFEELLDILTSVRMVEKLGSAVYIVRASYQNPIEVVLGGSGFLLLGVIYTLRLVRDWSCARRVGTANAKQAEATAARAVTQADLLQWLVDEAKAGRMHVRPTELVSVVTQPELQALDRLASNEINLKLPEDQ
jgi:hypothetical protein